MEQFDDVKMTIRARQLRLAVIKNLFDQNLLTLDDAKELLNASLTPGDDSTFCNDSDLLLDPNALDKINNDST